MNFFRVAMIGRNDETSGVGLMGWTKRFIACIYGLVKDFVAPVLTGLILYAPIDEKTVRYLGAIDIIFTW